MRNEELSVLETLIALHQLTAALEREFALLARADASFRSRPGTSEIAAVKKLVGRWREIYELQRTQGLPKD